MPSSKAEIEILSEDEYEIEEILKDKVVNGEIQFLIKWVGYAHNENTWEPQENIPTELQDEYYVLKNKKMEEAEKSENPEGQKKVKIEETGNKYKDVEITNEWINSVTKITGIEEQNGEILVDILMRNGYRKRVNKMELCIKCPLVLIEYYERHLDI